MCVGSATWASKGFQADILPVDRPIVPHEIIATHPFLLASQPLEENASYSSAIWMRQRQLTILFRDSTLYQVAIYRRWKKHTIHSVRKRKREQPLAPLPPLHIDNVQRVLQQAALHFVILLTAGRVRRGGINLNQPPAQRWKVMTTGICPASGPALGPM